MTLEESPTAPEGSRNTTRPPKSGGSWVTRGVCVGPLLLLTGGREVSQDVSSQPESPTTLPHVRHTTLPEAPVLPKSPPSTIRWSTSGPTSSLTGVVVAGGGVVGRSLSKSPPHLIPVKSGQSVTRVPRFRSLPWTSSGS